MVDIQLGDGLQYVGYIDVEVEFGGGQVVGVCQVLVQEDCVM